MVNQAIKKRTFCLSLFRALCVAFTATVFFVPTVVMRAQQNSITGGNYTFCDQFILDDGLSSSSAGVNVDATSTICPQAPETILNLQFLVFNLGPGDFLEIFDGSSAAAPLIGSFSGTQLEGQTITSNNTDGCLTLHFVTGASGTGNFNAAASCGLPCIPPVSVISSSEDPSPIRICPGETVDFSGAASQFAPGTTLANFEWDFDDGSTNTNSWPNVSHTFTEPGGYRVQLSLEDNTGCTNINLADYVVLVSTYPNFSLLENPGNVCNGEGLQIGANFNGNINAEPDSLNQWISQPWVDGASVDFGEGQPIPDEDCITSTITFGAFDDGASIQSEADFDAFHINFEHSYIPDLNITLICPNGQSVSVHQNQGGAGAFFGEASDAEPEGVPGVGYDYYWSPVATQGTVAEVSADLGLENILPSGTYASVAPWSNLFGCPLNGVWTMQICDTFGADDGTVFGWGVTFNPSFYDNTLSFAPVYGAACDSSFWSGAGIVSTSPLCDFATVSLEAPGDYTFTYTVINDFGCSFDTTIVITIQELPDVTAGPDQVFACTPLTLEGGLVNAPLPQCDQASGTYNYCYTSNEDYAVTYCPDNVGDGLSTISVTFNSGSVENIFDEFFVYNGNSVNSPLLGGYNWPLFGDLSGNTFTATGPTGCLTLQVTPDFTVDCAGGDEAPWNYTVSCPGGSYEFQWTPITFLSDATLSTPQVIGLNAPTTFTLSAYPTGHPECAKEDQVFVDITTTMTLAIEDSYLVCSNDTVRIAAPQISGGVAPFDISWELPDGSTLNTDSIADLVENAGTYCATVTDACNGSSEICTEVGFYPEIPAGFTVDTLIGCAPFKPVFQSDYTAYQNIARMVWHFDDGDSSTTVGSTSHTYWLHDYYRPWLMIEDLNGCKYYDTLTNNMIVWPKPDASFTMYPEEIILPSTTVFLNNTSTDASSYHWQLDNFGESDSTSLSYTFPEEKADDYLITLYATNQYGCLDTTWRVLEVSDDLTVYIPNSFTPNGDNVNDVWKVEGRGFTFRNFSVVIISRWGEPVFETNDPLQAWTGEVKNTGYFAPDGVYAYRVIIQDNQNDVNHVFEGHIYMVR